MGKQSKSESVEIKWEVSDGYVGASRPQRTRIDLEDIEHCDSLEEIESVIEEMIEESFARKISTDYNTKDVSEAAEKLFAMKSKESADAK